MLSNAVFRIKIGCAAACRKPFICNTLKHQFLWNYGGLFFSPTSVSFVNRNMVEFQVFLEFT